MANFPLQTANASDRDTLDDRIDALKACDNDVVSMQQGLELMV
jgi:hypothetical protein